MSQIKEQSAYYQLTDLAPVLKAADADNILLESLPVWLSAQTRKSAGRGRSANNTLQYGVQKLRELILELAVRGKLVPQDPNDEPASILLGKIAEEKARLVKQGKLKKHKSLTEVAASDEPFSIPTTWTWERLGNIGLVASSSRVHKKDWQDDGVPFYRAREIVLLSKNGSVENELFISNELFEKLAANGACPEPDDIMITGVGTIGTPYIVKNSDKFYFKDASVLTFKNFFGINAEYLFNFCKSPFWIESIHEGSMGTTVHTLTINRANEALIPLPPLAEQHRIVKKVDELMVLCDKLEQQQVDAVQAHDTLVKVLLDTLTQSENAKYFQQNWCRIAEHFDTLFTTESSIDQLKQTLLQLAVMGKLVPQDLNDEPASILLDKITREKNRLVKEGKLRAQQPSQINKTDLHDLPVGWIWTGFGEVTFNRDAERVPLSVDTRKHRRGNYDYYGASGIIDQIDDYLFEKPLLLIGEDGANLVNRSTPIAFIARGKYWVNNHAHVIDGFSESFLLYLSLYINSISLIPYITGTAQPKMNQAKMNSIPVALPPLTEQQRIVKKVDELMALCDQLKDRLNQSQTLQQQLADAVVETTI